MTHTQLSAGSYRAQRLSRHSARGLLFLTIRIEVIVLFGAAFGSSGRASEIVDLGTAPAGYTFSGGAINNAGEAFLNVSGPNSQTFLYNNSQMTNIGSLGSGGTQASSINDSGEIVGGSGGHPFVYFDGSIRSLPGSGGRPGFAYGVNDKGLVVGQNDVGIFLTNYQHGTFFYIPSLSSPDPNYVTILSQYPAGINNSGHIVLNTFQYLAPYGDFDLAFVSNGGGWQSVNPRGVIPPFGTGPIGIAVAINSKGQIAVNHSEAEVLSGYIDTYSNNQSTRIDTPFGEDSHANSINDAGDAVGAYGNVPYLYSNGTVTDLSSLLPVNSGWTIREADDINNSGQIFGFGMFNGEEHAFILDTAVPEPASVALFGAGILLVGLLGSARRRVEAKACIG